MNSVEEFLAYAIKLEEEAMLRFGELADSMATYGNTDVSKLFRRLSQYSALHMGDAKARAGFRTIPTIANVDFHWPAGESPERAAIWGADPFLARDEALAIALEAERAGLAFYAQVLATTTDPEIVALAKEFVAEETEHVEELLKWIGARGADTTTPVEA
ncbi:rubrerythrin [Siculibacillus lacustris]|uniref:Rubrerythrin n=1 Tax=Siculibacillus lacustris TaxID=1549641 RepID=A0A4Q9VQB1_9HYPH|nr:ferritin family protein [Siculibacillus lacustris]TBW38007.1 rubrerythrin [Siculibacillus lacustris]